MPSAAEGRGAAAWVESLSPWPNDGFGLGRIHTLLAALGDPQRRYPAIHVVGTNGKSTTTRMAEALLLAAGLRAGAYLSPHVTGWGERIRVAGAEVDFERAVARVRPEAERLGATQFEVLTATALAEFAAAGVDVAVVEAGLGGRHDATNVLDSRVVVLTSVALEHTEVLGSTREEIAAEKLAVIHPGATVVLSEPEWEPLARSEGAARVEVVARSNLALALAAAEAFLGRDLDPAPAERVSLPGRLERRGERPLEFWDGAHNMAGIGWLLARVPERRYVLVVSILEDKRPELMLRALSVLGETIVVTESSSGRAVCTSRLAGLARPYYRAVHGLANPGEAVGLARELAGPDGAVLVTGSLYLLGDLYKDEGVRWRTSATS